MVGGNQDGFTLAEVITAFALLGVLVVVAVPIYSELSDQQQLRDQQYMVLLTLQEQMERLGTEKVPTSGKIVKKDTSMGPRPFIYEVSWEKKRETSFTMRAMVEIRWKDIKDRKRVMRLENILFTP